ALRRRASRCRGASRRSRARHAAPQAPPPETVGCRRRGSGSYSPGPCGEASRELLLQLTEHAVAVDHLADRRVRLPALADRGDEPTVLPLDAVHADGDVRDVDLLLLAGEQIVVARDVGRRVADVAEERAERTVVVERERQGADRAGLAL